MIPPDHNNLGKANPSDTFCMIYLVQSDISQKHHVISDMAVMPIGYYMIVDLIHIRKDDRTMFKEDFYKRLTELRVKEDVSAREMSLSIGKNPGYIFEVERGNSMPSMETFFFICDYLHITPKQFFDTNIDNPMEFNEAVKLIKMLNPDQLSHILEVIKDVLQIPKFKR